jgi:hypothetical protein
MKLLIILCISLASSAFAQKVPKLDLLDLCQGQSQSLKSSIELIPLSKADLLVVDKGFCTQYISLQSDIEAKETVKEIEMGLDINIVDKCPEPIVTSSDKWKIRFYASHSFTTYFDTDVKFNSSRYNVEIKDYEWAERGSRKYFKPKTWKEPGNNPTQFIDEPSNTFTVSLEKDGNEFFLSAFHPKFIQAPDQVKHISGTIDGVQVDELAKIDKPFDGYNQVPGESEIISNDNTHRQMSFELGYGRRFKLIDTKIGSIRYVPSIGFGIITGENYSEVIKPNEWWESDKYEAPYGIKGYGGSITNRLEVNSKNERVGFFYENKFANYKMDHAFLDGTQSYNLSFMGNSVGMKFMIYNSNKE